MRPTLRLGTAYVFAGALSFFFSRVHLGFFVDVWNYHGRVDYRPGLDRGLDRVVWRRRLGRRNEGQGDVEVPQVTNAALRLVLVVTHPPCDS